MQLVAAAAVSCGDEEREGLMRNGGERGDERETRGGPGGGNDTNADVSAEEWAQLDGVLRAEGFSSLSLQQGVCKGECSSVIVCLYLCHGSVG